MVETVENNNAAFEAVPRHAFLALQTHEELLQPEVLDVDSKTSLSAS